MFMKFMASLLILAMICAVSILAMIYGWGLTPQNWPVIIGAYVVTFAFQVITMALRD